MGLEQPCGYRCAVVVPAEEHVARLARDQPHRPLPLRLGQIDSRMLNEALSLTELGTELNDTSEDLALVGALGVVVTSATRN